MSSVPLITGATHVLKITPNSALIPATISGIDHLFNLFLLSNSKFSNWKSTASASGRIGIMDIPTSAEVSRYIDLNFDIANNIGALWFLGDAEVNHSFYIQTGKSISKSNSINTFVNHSMAYGFNEISGDVIDRCGNCSSSSETALTYNEDAIINKGIEFNNGSYAIIPAPNDLDNETKLTIHILGKMPAGQRTVYAIEALNFFDVPVALNCCIGVTDTGIAQFPTIDSDFALFTVVFDGTLTGDSNRLKFYKNGVLQTPDGWLVPGVGSALQDFSSGGQIGQAGVDSNGMILDELRFIKKAATVDEITWRYNQWLNQSSYWTVTVQPIISSVNYLGGYRYRLKGSGFLPASTNPNITINGNAVNIESVMDSTVILKDVNGTYNGSKLFSITNSDNETDTFTLYNACISDMGIINISQFVDNNIDVVFVNNDGTLNNFSKVHLGNAGFINIVGIGYNDSDAKRIYLSAGRWHDIGGIYKILYSGTETGLDIHIKV